MKRVYKCSECGSRRCAHVREVCEVCKDRKAVNLNTRYSEIRARANELMDSPRHDAQDWQNEHFELNVEYLAVCDQLKALGYTGIENFPGNED